MGILGIFTVADASIVVALIGLAATFVNTRRNGRKIEQINKAVNHVGADEPTLVQRVKNLEAAAAKHAEWEVDVFHRIASQIGVELPPRPDKTKEAA